MPSWLRYWDFLHYHKKEGDRGDLSLFIGIRCKCILYGKGFLWGMK